MAFGIVVVFINIQLKINASLEKKYITVNNIYKTSGQNSLAGLYSIVFFFIQNVYMGMIGNNMSERGIRG